MNVIRDAMKTLNFKNFLTPIFESIAAVLHMGNVAFSANMSSSGMEGVAIKNPDSKYDINSAFDVL